MPNEILFPLTSNKKQYQEELFKKISVGENKRKYAYFSQCADPDSMDRHHFAGSRSEPSPQNPTPPP